METAANGQSGGFAHMIRRIWNGPEEEEEPSKMQSAKSGTDSYDPQREERFDRGEKGNRSFRPDYQTRPEPPEQTDTPDFEVDPGNSTVISKGTVVTGDIKSDGDVEMFGSMTGSISTTGRVKVNGKQNGDVQGSSVSLSDCTVKGNVGASDAVLVDSGSVIVGDIKCGGLTFDGKIKGNVHVMGNVECKSNAVVIGDVTSTTITVESGARLQGTVQISDGSIDKIDLPDEGGAPVPEPQQ